VSAPEALILSIVWLAAWAFTAANNNVAAIKQLVPIFLLFTNISHCL
jgi:hypothetical protein